MTQNVGVDIDADVYFYGYSDDNYDVDYDTYSSESYAVRFCGDPLWVNETFSEWRLPLFSWCFQHAVLAQLPVLFFFLSLPFLWMRYRMRGGVGSLPYDWLTSMKYGLTVIMIGDKLAILIRSLYQWAFAKQKVPIIEFLYPLVNAIALACVIVTVNRCRTAGIVAPGALLWTWALFVVCSVPEFFVWIIIGTNPLTVNSVDFCRYLAFLIWFPLCCLQLFLHLFPDHVDDVKQVDDEARASPLGRHFLTWFTRVVRHAYIGNQLDIGSLPVLPERLRARTLFHRWNGEWTRRLRIVERRQHQFSSFINSCSHCSRHEDAVQVGGDSPTTIRPGANNITPLIDVISTRSYGSIGPDNRQDQDKSALFQPLSIFWCLIRVQRWPMIYGCAFRVIADVSRFIGPLLLIEMIRFLEIGTLPHWRGYGIALAMFVVAQIASMAHSAAYITVCQTRVGAEGMLRVAVYDKVLRLFANARFAVDRRALSVVLAGDVANAERAVLIVVRIVSLVVQTLFGIILLWHMVGIASLVAVMFLAVYGYGNACLEAVEKSTHPTLNDATKSRVETMRILLRESKFVEEQMIKADVVDEAKRLRDVEMRLIRRLKTGQCALSIFNESAEFVAFFLTLLCYVGLNIRNKDVIPPETIFVTIFVISILRRSFCAAVNIRRQIKTMNASNDHLVALLMEEEIDQTQVERDLHPEWLHSDLGLVNSTHIPSYSETGGRKQSERLGYRMAFGHYANDERTVDIQLASFDDSTNWKIGDLRPPGYSYSPHIVHATYALNDVEMHVKRGVLAAVVTAPGRVDDGARLLHAILGEMRTAYGYVGLRGRVAYCPRRPWLLDDTVRANILLRHSDGIDNDEPVDEERYRFVLNACELNALPNGDQSLAIDDCGDSDLGIQIALARLAYRRADVYLLEDILSTASNKRLATRLYARLIDDSYSDNSSKRPLFDGCTRIVVERLRDHVKRADLVILVDEQKVKFSGIQSELARDEFAAQLAYRYTIDDNSNALDQPDDTLKSADDTEAASFSLLRTEVAEMRRLVDEEPARSACAPYMSAARGHLFTIAVNFMTGSVAFAVINQYWLCDWANPQFGEKPEVSERFFVLFIIGIFMVLSQAAGLFAVMYGTVNIGQRAFDVVAETLREIPLDAIPARKIARIHYSAVKDMERLDWAASEHFNKMLLNGFRVLFILILFVVRWPYLVIEFIIFTAVAFPITMAFVKITTPLRRLGVVTLDALLLRTREAAEGLVALRAADAAKPFLRDFLTLVDKRGAAEYARMMARRWMAARMELIGSIFILVVALSGALASFFQLTPAFVALFVITNYQLGDLLKEFAKQLAGFEFEAGGVRQIFDIQTPEKVHSDKRKGVGVAPESKPKSSVDESAGRWHGDVRIVDLTCAPNILCNFSAHFAPRTKIGVLKCEAASDALWAVLTGRVAAPTAVVGGRVTIDGVDASYGAHFAVVSTHAPLLAGRLRFNLNPAGDRSDTQLWRAIEAANLRTFVESRPGGLDAQIDVRDEKITREVRVSIAIARAVLRRRRRLLLLDDAQFVTRSKFDTWARQRLYNEFADATIIHFSARTENLDRCDRIIDFQPNNHIDCSATDQVLTMSDTE